MKKEYTERQKQYFEKLKDPRWQKKRLEILERDGWKCQCCGDKDKTLHVHHKQYISGHDPWEYDDEMLETLCFACHEAETEIQGDLRNAEADLLANLRQCQFYHRLMADTLTTEILGQVIAKEIAKRQGRPENNDPPTEKG